MYNFNVIQFIFITLTFTLSCFAILINFLNKYVPTVLVRSFKYGKFACSKRSPLAEISEVPKAYFKHFYANALIWNIFLIYICVSVCYLDYPVPKWFKTVLDVTNGYDRMSSGNLMQIYVSVILMTMQISHRFYDTHFISVFGKSAKINLLHYIIGMIYYPCVVIAILGNAPKFAPGKIITGHISLMEYFAISTFLCACYHQQRCTVILANLRKNNGKIVTEKYEIPFGDWFKYFSSPHSVTEIIMYGALAVLLRQNKTIVIIFFWVLANQFETSYLSHRWYQDTFKSKFPNERKILLPFIY